MLGVLILVAEFASFRSGSRYLQLPWGTTVRQTFATDLNFAVFVGLAMALGFGLSAYLLGLTGKSDMFTFGREMLKIRDRAWATSGIGEMLIRWDSVTRITLERRPRYGEFRYCIVAKFQPGSEPSPSLLRRYGGWLMRYGGRQRPDGGYVIYRSGYWHHRGVRFSQLRETFPQYADFRYVDPDHPLGR